MSEGKLNGLDLFSGIGGISLALEPWVKTIAYCERDLYAQGVLMSRMRDGSLDQAPIWDDVQTLRAENFETSVDIIFGGFPCQDISVAGRGVGLEGKRSGLFYEIARLVSELAPSFVFLENVPAIRTRGLIDVVRTLADLGYDCRWTSVSAAEIGAPHLRKRWFLLAHRTNKRCNRAAAISEAAKRKSESKAAASRNGQALSLANTNGANLRNAAKSGIGTVSAKSRHDGATESLANAASVGRSSRRTESAGIEGRPESSRCGSSMGDSNGFGLPNTSDELAEERPESSAELRPCFAGASWWATEPDVDRVVNGLPKRVDRIRCLGNSVVPKQAREAFERLLGIEGRREGA